MPITDIHPELRMAARLLPDEAIAYGARLAAAGVPCTVEVTPGAFHGFDQLLPWKDVTKRFNASQFACMREALGL